MPDSQTSSASMALQRGKACSNCRRRKIRCDGNRPCCNQCHLSPTTACEYVPPNPNKVRQTPKQMMEHIQGLEARIQELRHLSEGGEIKSPLLLHHPYRSDSGSSGSPTPEPLFGSPTSPPLIQYIQEPPADLITTLIDTFLDRFTHNEFFFLNQTRFSGAALLPMPFGHPDRPSRTLLNVIYLWGSISTPSHLYTEDGFLEAALKALPQDIADLSLNPHLVLQTLQAEVLLSYYYLRSARPVEGRYYSTTAMSLALDAGFHVLSPMSLRPEVYPPFPLVQVLLPPAVDAEDVPERIKAFWSVWLLNNYWVAVQGTPSAVPHGISIETPWPGDSGGGATIAKFLNGQNQDSLVPAALLAKASTLLEHIITFSARTKGAPVFASFATRLRDFQSNLPPFQGSNTLLIAHALTDLPLCDASRFDILGAAGRIVMTLSHLGESAADAVYDVDPILPLVCETICNVFMDELSSLRAGVLDRQRRVQYQEIKMQLINLMNIMSTFEASSPVAQHCLTIVRHAYSFHCGTVGDVTSEDCGDY
ncbi:hypothetical protein B0H17DRAFT_1144444 [Mycena rosella]|uniref:Zn(2)-C6 fungal-type domain-containing protein n=1 Tax=Mycena rosella TaxID=1033263 RepID=A0AAD7G715_MYCRO|nr:hypothetical protein B0H17DRAFT_1144444 [Mycena rosella]